MNDVRGEGWMAKGVDILGLGVDVTTVGVNVRGRPRGRG